MERFIPLMISGRFALREYVETIKSPFYLSYFPERPKMNTLYMLILFFSPYPHPFSHLLRDAPDTPYVLDYDW